MLIPFSLDKSYSSTQSKINSYKRENEIFGDIIERFIANINISLNFKTYGSVLENVWNNSSALFSSLYFNVAILLLPYSFFIIQKRTP